MDGLTVDATKEIMNQLDIHSFIQFCSANHQLVGICDDEVLWKNKYERYYRFSGMMKYKTTYKHLVMLCYQLDILLGYFYNVNVYQRPTTLLQLRQLYEKTTLDSEPTKLGQPPDHLDVLIHLDTLKIYYAHMSVIPSSLFKLTNLTHLDLSHNQIQIIPSEIGDLIHLTFLDLSYNQIIIIPPEIGQLQHLTYLSLSHNQITIIPTEMGQLQHLTQLYLNQNQITFIPYELIHLTNIRYIQLYYNNNLHQFIRSYDELKNYLEHQHITQTLSRGDYNF